MKKLFDPFFSTKEGGVGLGLSIAHRIVDQHRGKIEIESAPGQGTRINLWLPISQEEGHANHPGRG
jgi:signal transduction histidine kinase